MCLVVGVVYLWIPCDFVCVFVGLLFSLTVWFKSVGLLYLVAKWNVSYASLGFAYVF